MLTVTGYYDQQVIEETVSDQDLFVHCCGRYKLVSREIFETRRPNGTNNYQLLYVADGRAEFMINDKCVIVEKGQCVLYQPKEPQYYKYLLKYQPDIYWIHFSGNEVKDFLIEMSISNGIFGVGVHSSYLTFFNQIIKELQLKELHFEQSTTLLLRQLLLTISRNIHKINERPYAYNLQVEKAIRYFHSMPEKEFVIKDYTKEHHINYYRFIDSFSKYTGLAPKQYIIQIRISKAKELLTNEMLSVAEVGNLVGYENALYFSRLFKQEVGLSPLHYRQQLRKGEHKLDET